MKTSFSVSVRAMAKTAAVAVLTLAAACGGQPVDEAALPEPIAAQPEAVGSTSSALSASQLSALQDQMLAEVNKARAVGRSCGTTFYKAAPPLKRDSRLDAAAQEHSADMAKNNYFDHYSQDGRSPFDRISAAGYKYRAAAENIAAGYPDVARTMGQWLKSAGHCRNIMNPTYVHIGIGYAQNASATYQNYWTQTFGTPQ